MILVSLAGFVTFVALLVTSFQGTNFKGDDQQASGSP